MDNNCILYSLNVEDAQNVANEGFERDLTEEELKQVEDRLGDYIDWYGALEFAINDVIS